MTLGISTNTRLLGFAVINRDSLVDYSIHLHKSPWSPSKANLILTKLEPCVRQYCIKRVVLSIPHAYHQTEAFHEVNAALKAYFQSNNIPVYEERADSFHRLLPQNQKKTKKVLMEYLVAKFPQLTYCYLKELKNKNRYYFKLFEAVAVALVGKRK